MTDDVKGPFIVWENYGYEGWKPTSYPDLPSALTSQKFNYEFEITKKIEFKVSDKGEVTATWL